MTLTHVNDMFKAFSDETRIRILHLLTKGELCVCDLVDILKIPQSKISRHLSTLKNAGMFNCRKDGLWAYYSLSSPINSIHKAVLDTLPPLNELFPLKEDLKKFKRIKKRLTNCS